MPWLSCGSISCVTKDEAIAMLGGTVSAAAQAIGVSYQAVKKWPATLSPRVADRVLAAAARGGQSPTGLLSRNTSALPAANVGPVAQAALTKVQNLILAGRLTEADCLQLLNRAMELAGETSSKVGRV